MYTICVEKRKNKKQSLLRPRKRTISLSTMKPKKKDKEKSISFSANVISSDKSDKSSDAAEARSLRQRLLRKSALISRRFGADNAPASALARVKETQASGSSSSTPSRRKRAGSTANLSGSAVVGGATGKSIALSKRYFVD